MDLSYGNSYDTNTPHSIFHSPDRITTTPNNTPILQTQTTTTQSQNLQFLETNSPESDSCDESFTVYQNTKKSIHLLISIKHNNPRPLDIDTFVLKKFPPCSFFTQNWTI